MNKGLKTALIVGGVVFAAVVVLSFVPGMLGGWPRYGYGMMGGYGLMFFMPLLGILLVGLIVWVVVAATRKPGEADHTTGQSESPLDILKKRYARGEINKEEFEGKKRDLM